MNIQSVLGTVAALTMGVVPVAQAGVVLPNLYAREYCAFRNIGVSEDEAMTAAVEASYVDNGVTAVKVTIDGVRYDSDVVRALRAANELCPGL